MATSLPLVFDAPRRALPPRHLADLDEDARAAAVAELGLPPFRGKQLANQYYGRLIAEAHPSKTIAKMLSISVKTVERHRANILVKLGMRDRVELTRYAIRRGLVEP